MDCEQLKDLIPLFALDALDADEATAIRAHLAAGCPLCEGRLSETHALLTMLPLGLPQIAPPSAVKGRLMQRVSAGGNSAASKGPVSAGWKIGPAIMGLAAGALIAAAGLWYVVGTHRHSEDALRQQLAAKDKEIQSVTSDLENFKTEINLIKSPTLQVVRLEGQPAQPNAVGHVFIDHVNNNIMFCGVNMKGLTPNKVYELWLVSGDKKIPAGVFSADAHGEAMYVQKMPPNVGALAAAAVTDEPVGGVAQPTGSFQLLGVATN